MDPQGSRDGRTLGPALSLFRKEPEIQRGLVTCSRSHSKQWPRRDLTPQFLSPPSQDPSPHSSGPSRPPANAPGFFSLFTGPQGQRLQPLPHFLHFQVLKSSLSFPRKTFWFFFLFFSLKEIREPSLQTGSEACHNVTLSLRNLRPRELWLEKDGTPGLSLELGQRLSPEL